MLTRICLIRHGETAWNADKRIQGQTDVPLNDNGLRQARAMAADAARHDFAAVYCSDLQRARDTAALLVKGRGLQPLPLPSLRERHFGVLQGLTAAEAVQRQPDAYVRHKARDPDCAFETGESLRAFAARAEAALREIAVRHPGQTVAVVAHAGVLDTLYRAATGRPLHTARDFALPNCALNWFAYDGERWHLEAWNDHHYLPGGSKEAVE